MLGYFRLAFVEAGAKLGLKGGDLGRQRRRDALGLRKRDKARLAIGKEAIAFRAHQTAGGAVQLHRSYAIALIAYAPFGNAGIPRVGIDFIAFERTQAARSVLAPNVDDMAALRFDAVSNVSVRR